MNCSSERRVEALTMRLLQRPLACSWRSLSTCNITAAVALFLYSRARVVARVFSLALRLSFETRFVFSRRSAYDSAGAFSLRLVSVGSLAQLLSLPAFCSRLCSHLCSRLCSASVSSLPRLRFSLVYYFYRTFIFQ